MSRRILLQTYQVLADPNPISAEPPTTTSSDNKMPTNLQNPYQNQSFDSSMGLTILVLLSALFFMGFFSVYIRRFAHDSSPVHLSRTTRRLRSPSTTATTTTTLANVTRLCGTGKGLDFDSIQALPVVKFSSELSLGDVVVDCCAVCLAEFEEGESLKMLPTCQHLFHVECIDTWLVSRASCPLCRTTKIFKEEKAEIVMVDVTEVSGGGGVRRCCSCSGIDVEVVVVEEDESDSAEGRRGGLQRTRSF